MDDLGEGAQIPLLGKMEIMGYVDELLDECWDGMFPIDVEAICDYLGIAIVPVKKLFRELHMDAFIAADFKTVYVDWDGYVSNGVRYRFSLAHELGHFVLHREYYPSRVEGLEEWRALTRWTKLGFVEAQANSFAGCLLAPEDELIRLLNREFGGSFARNCWLMERGDYWNALRHMGEFFRVSKQVVVRRTCDTIYGLKGYDEMIMVR